MAFDGRRRGLPSGRMLVMMLVAIGFFLSGTAVGIVTDRTLFDAGPTVVRVVKVVPDGGREPARACEALPSFFGRCADADQVVPGAVDGEPGRRCALLPRTFGPCADRLGR